MPKLLTIYHIFQLTIVFEILQHICENCNLQQCTCQNNFIPVTTEPNSTSTSYVPKNKLNPLKSTNADVLLNDSQQKNNQFTNNSEGNYELSLKEDNAGQFVKTQL